MSARTLTGKCSVHCFINMVAPCYSPVQGRAGLKKLSQKPAVRDNRGTPPHPDFLPRSGGEGVPPAPSPSGRGLGEGAFPRIDAQSCYDVLCVPSFETLSETRPYICSSVLLPKQSTLPPTLGAGLKLCEQDNAPADLFLTVFLASCDESAGESHREKTPLCRSPALAQPLRALLVPEKRM